MTQSEEAQRYVLERVSAGGLRPEQAAEVLGVSERHVWRLLAALPRAGSAGAGPRQPRPPAAQRVTDRSD